MAGLQRRMAELKLKYAYLREKAELKLKYAYLREKAELKLKYAYLREKAEVIDDDLTELSALNKKMHEKYVASLKTLKEIEDNDDMMSIDEDMLIDEEIQNDINNKNDDDNDIPEKFKGLNVKVFHTAGELAKAVLKSDSAVEEFFKKHNKQS